MESFGARVKYLRKQAGRTLKELAGLLGLSISYISQLEKGKKTPSEQTILNICRTLRVSREWLENGRGSSDAGIGVRFYKKEDLKDPQIDGLVRDLWADPVLKEILWKGLHGSPTQRKYFKPIMELAAEFMGYRPPRSGIEREVNRKEIEKGILSEMKEQAEEPITTPDTKSGHSSGAAARMKKEKGRDEK